MIRLNLLPRDDKGSSGITFRFKAGEMVVPFALLAAVALVITGTVVSQRMTISTLARSISDVDAESRALGPQIERVNRLAQERAELDLRLGVIHKLEQGRTRSVRLMDELAGCVPDHLWLTSATEEGNSLSLEGLTFSNLVISDFMSSLERSPMFAAVELEVAERGEAGEGNVVKFRLTCQITPDETAQ